LISRVSGRVQLLDVARPALRRRLHLLVDRSVEVGSITSRKIPTSAAGNRVGSSDKM
jgi:hypothetical protein